MGRGRGENNILFKHNRKKMLMVWNSILARMEKTIKYSFQKRTRITRGEKKKIPLEKLWGKFNQTDLSPQSWHALEG